MEASEALVMTVYCGGLSFVIGIIANIIGMEVDEAPLLIAMMGLASIGWPFMLACLIVLAIGNVRKDFVMVKS